MFEQRSVSSPTCFAPLCLPLYVCSSSVAFSHCRGMANSYSWAAWLLKRQYAISHSYLPQTLSFSQTGAHLWTHVAMGMIYVNCLRPGAPQPRRKGLSWLAQTHKPSHHPLPAQAENGSDTPKLYGCYIQKEGIVNVLETTSKSTIVYTGNLVTLLAEAIYDSCVGSWAPGLIHQS